MPHFGSSHAANAFPGEVQSLLRGASCTADTAGGLVAVCIAVGDAQGGWMAEVSPMVKPQGRPGFLWKYQDTSQTLLANFPWYFHVFHFTHKWLF